MTSEEPKVTLNGRYSVREAGEILGVNRCTINRWIACGELMCGVRRTNGRRFIYGRELIRFWER